MTEFEKKENGLPYNPSDKNICSMQLRFSKLLFKLNKLPSFKIKAKEKLFKKMFGKYGKNNYIELPFFANWGGKNIFIGNNFYANFHLTVVDDGKVFIGDNVLIGPNVTIATTNHVIDPFQRLSQMQYVKDVTISDNVWIGSNVVILPGVTIGKNSIIGAGSVVTKNIPENVIAFGNPCKVKKEII